VLRIAIAGAGGQMGRAICRAALSAQDLEVVAAIDPAFAGRSLLEVVGAGASSLVVDSSLEGLARSSAEVVVEFSTPLAAMDNLRACASAGVHVVSGTTGLTEDDLAELSSLFSPPSRANCIWAPNFAVGAVLLLHLAEIAAPFFDGAEIIELHHPGKRDAPSGTALLSASRISAARERAGLAGFGGDRTEIETLEAVRGGRGAGGTRIHSVRLPGLVAHEEVLFGGEGQSLSIRHDSFDRGSFLPGIFRAIHAVATRPGLTIGLAPLLGLPGAAPTSGGGVPGAGHGTA
jgi:4-hydroxy-tetrahydrodipicolinate reductase